MEDIFIEKKKPKIVWNSDTEYRNTVSKIKLSIGESRELSSRVTGRSTGSLNLEFGWRYLCIKFS